MSCGQYTESAAGRIRVVTSGTRPTGVDRYVGQRIFESDTGRELLYDGSGWIIMYEPLQAFVPVFLNTTTGNGTKAGVYQRRGGWCDFQAYFVLGTTSAVSGSVQLTLPFAGSVIRFGQFSVSLTDTSAGQVFTGQSNSDPTNTTIYSAVVSGSNIGVSFLGATSPFTWANGDAIEVSGSYPMSNRYA